MTQRQRRDLDLLVTMWRHSVRLWSAYGRTHSPEDYGVARRHYMQNLYPALTRYGRLYMGGGNDDMTRAVALAEVVRESWQAQLTFVD